MASMQQMRGPNNVYNKHIPSIDVALFQHRNTLADMIGGTSKAFASIPALRYVVCVVRWDLLH